MRIVNAKCGSVIPIGRLGENDAVQVIFDVANWVTTYGNGTFNLLNKRNGDANAYPCDVIEDNGKLLWNINSADVANVGYGQCEIVYIVGDTIAKSEIYTTIVGKALTGGGDVPEPWEDWVERVLQAGVDAQDAKYVWENMTAVGVESSEVFAEYENGVLTVGVPMGGGTYDHGQLSNRDANNQHPINAITGLQSALDGKQPVGDYATTQDVSDLADIVDTKADASDIPSLDGYATEQWVENKGYLTEHQSLDGYATETYVNSHHDDTKQDAISDLATIRSGAALGATALQSVPSGYATEAYVDSAISAAIGNIDNLVGSGVIA